MDFIYDKDCANAYDSVLISSVEHSFDCDATLPEYMPDIVRVLRCSATPYVQTYQHNGDRITAECSCLVKTLYICAEGKLHCFDQTLHFAKQLECSSDVGTELYVCARADYVNYRLTGQRRLQLHGAVAVSAMVSQKSPCEFVCSAKGGGVTARCENDEICDLIAIVEKAFTTSETIDMGVLSESVGAIISQNAFATINELKVISGKLFLKGDMTVQLTFTGQETGQLLSFEGNVAINQIIEAPDTIEDCSIDACLSAFGLEVHSRFDSAGNKNLLDVTVALCFSAQCYTTRQITCIKDAYSTKYEAQVKKSLVNTYTLEDKIDDSMLCRHTVDLSATGISKILSLTFSQVTDCFTFDEECARLSGEATANIIYESAEGEITFVQRQLPYEYKRPLQSGGDLVCRPHCSAGPSSFVIVDGNRLDIRVEITISAFVFSRCEKECVTDIQIDTQRPKVCKSAALTVYFADCDEELWSIAEKYNTTVDAIMGENHLTSGTVEKPCKLLIPKV